MMKGKLYKMLILAAALVLAALVLTLVLVGNRNSSEIRVGFVMTGSTDDIGWNGIHYTSAKTSCEKLGAKLMIKENIAEGTGDCEKAIRELAEKGADMIILTSYSYPIEALETIKGYPDIAFYAISSNVEADNVTSYFGRMYQARYLAGIIAGMQTETGSIGYVAAMPNCEVNRGINAFTLGVRSVNANASVNVIWTNSWDNSEAETAATERLVEELNADVVTYHQNRHSTAETADRLGVYSIGYNTAVEGLSEKYLTASVWNWDSLYFQIMREFIQGEANTSRRQWYSIDNGAVGLSEYSSAVSEETRLAVEAAKSRFLSGIDVFSGEIYDNSGRLRCGEGETINDNTLFNDMDWFVNGVVIYE